MRKSLSFLKTAMAAGLLAAVFAVNAMAAEITEERAKAIALENAGIEEENITFIRAEQDREDGKTIFEVEFLTKGNEEYDYQILAENGEILGIEYEKKAPATSQGKKGNEITLEQAEEIALKQAGQTAESVTFIKRKADIDDGRLIYEVEFYNSNYQKYEYEIEGKSGEILAWDFEADSLYARQDTRNKKEKTNEGKKDAGQTASKEGGISQAEAKAAALKAADLQENQVIWGQVHKKYDDGRLIYEGEFFHNQMEYEFEIDAISGSILDWDVESIYD